MPIQPRPPTYGGRKNRSGPAAVSSCCAPGRPAHHRCGNSSLWWPLAHSVTNDFLPPTNQVGAPWLSRSVTSGSARQITRTWPARSSVISCPSPVGARIGPTAARCQPRPHGRAVSAPAHGHHPSGAGGGRGDEPHEVVVRVHVDELPAVRGVVWVARPADHGFAERAVELVDVLYLEVRGGRGGRGFVVVFDEQVQLRGIKPGPGPGHAAGVRHDLEAESLIVGQGRLHVADRKAGREAAGTGHDPESGSRAGHAATPAGSQAGMARRRRIVVAMPVPVTHRSSSTPETNAVQPSWLASVRYA